MKQKTPTSCEENINSLQKNAKNHNDLDTIMESEDNVPQQLNSSISSIDKNLSSLCDLVSQRIQNDEAKEKAFNYLYTELDDYKKNKVFEEIRPIMVDLILLYGRCKKVCPSCFDRRTLSMKTRSKNER